jgi:hypothetical protein
MSGKRYYTCNYNYFHNIDSKEKAYWLGFIMADGCIVHNERIRHLKTQDVLQIRNYLQISLSSIDRKHLEKFNNSLESTYPIKDYTIGKSGYKPGSPYSRIIIEDKTICDDLKLNGILPKKQLKEMYPTNLDPQYNLDFIRGFFDGDGCISCHKNKHGNPEYEFSFTGTKEMLTSIANILGLTLTEKRLKSRHPERNLNNYTMKFCGTQQTFKVMSMLYENASIYLDRKYNKYIELVNYINGRHA